VKHIDIQHQFAFQLVTKTCDIQHHFDKDSVQRGEAQFDYAASKLNTAEMLTKAASRGQLEKLLAFVGLVDVAQDNTAIEHVECIESGGVLECGRVNRTQYMHV
jgi:hypothetical protein